MMKFSKSAEGSLVSEADVGAFELHLRQLYLYYKGRRRRGQAVLVVSSAWACYNVSVWVRGWMEAGTFSWFLLLNTVFSVALASACLRSTYRDGQLYVPHRYEDRSNGTLGLLGLCFDGQRKAGNALQRQAMPAPKSRDRGGGGGRAVGRKKR